MPTTPTSFRLSRETLAQLDRLAQLVHDEHRGTLTITRSDAVSIAVYGELQRREQAAAVPAADRLTIGDDPARRVEVAARAIGGSAADRPRREGTAQRFERYARAAVEALDALDVDSRQQGPPARSP
jgi:hypothetical protein